MSDRRSRPYHNNRGWHGGRGGGGGGNKPQWSKPPLEAGMRGFVCTCNNQEKNCIREALNLLNEYADLLFGKEDWRASPAGASEAGEKTEGESASATDDKQVEGDDEEEDIADALKKEVQHLQAQTTTRRWSQRFRVLASGAKNYVFISTTVPDPTLLVHRLLSDLKASQQQRCRFLLRMLPIEASCRTNLEDITNTASKLFDKYFAQGGKSFAVIYKCRNNSGVSRDALIEALADLIKLKNASNYADLGNPQLAVLVEIVRNVCCLSVVPDYFQLAKYNLLEVAAPPKDKQPNVGERPDPEGQESGDETEPMSQSDPPAPTSDPQVTPTEHPEPMSQSTPTVDTESAEKAQKTSD